MTILDAFGNPVKSTQKPDTRPIASARMIMSERDYVTAGLTPQRLAAIFRDADAGDIAQQAELFEQIEEKDGHLRGESSKRINVITDVEFALEPATDAQRDLDVCDFVQAHLLDMPDWPDTMTGLNESVGKGISAFEQQWDVSTGQAIITNFEFIHQRRFRFVDDAGYVCKTPKLISDMDLLGAPIDPWKVVMHRYGGKTGNATRAALYRICAWMFLFKNYAVKDWLIFTEVYGMPLRIGKYDPGASKDDKTALITAIKSIGTDAAGIISKSTEIEFIEAAKGTDTGELYALLKDFANEEISKALLGQTTTAGLKDVGAYSAVESFKGVSMDLVKADSRALPSTVSAQTIRPLVGFNFGWDTPLPTYKAVWDEDEDLNQKSEWVDKLLNRGVRMPVKWLRTEFKIPEPEDGEETVGGFSGTGSNTEPEAPLEKTAKHIAKQTPAPPEKDAADLLADQLDAETQPMVTGMLDTITGIVARAESLEGLKTAIENMFGALAPDALAEIIAQALVAGKLAGMSEVADE